MQTFYLMDYMNANKDRIICRDKWFAIKFKAIKVVGGWGGGVMQSLFNPSL